MSANKKIAFAGIVSALFVGAGVASADTITVTDYQVGGVDLNLAPPLVAPNTYAYQYDVAFDGNADIATNDGFVVYDFANPTTLKGSSSNLSFLDGDSTLIADFATGQTSAATGSDGLNDSAPLAKILADAPYTDRASAPNIIFAYTPNITYNSGVESDLLLTLYSSTPNSSLGFSQGLDNSGSGSGFAVSLKPVLVPTVVPEPGSISVLLLGGMGLLARRRKA